MSADLQPFSYFLFVILAAVATTVMASDSTGKAIIDEDLGPNRQLHPPPPLVIDSEENEDYSDPSSWGCRCWNLRCSRPPVVSV